MKVEDCTCGHVNDVALDRRDRRTKEFGVC